MKSVSDCMDEDYGDLAKGQKEYWNNICPIGIKNYYNG